MNKNESKIIGVASSLALAGVITILGSKLFQTDWIVFYINSILLSFMPIYMVGGRFPMPAKESIQLGLIAFLIYSVLYFLLSVSHGVSTEKLLFAIPLASIISYLAFRINDRRIIKVKDFFK